MWNRSKKFLALLVCINFVQFGAIALALEADEDQGAATGGSTERYDGGDRDRDRDRDHRRWHRATPSPTPMPSASPMPTATPTPKPSPSPMPSASPMPSPTPSPTPMPTASPTPMPSPTPSPTPTPAKTWSMYNQYCAGCHGTSKQGSSATSIQNAINNLSAMSSLKFLTSAQITAIAAGQ